MSKALAAVAQKFCNPDRCQDEHFTFIFPFLADKVDFFYSQLFSLNVLRFECLI